MAVTPHQEEKIEEVLTLIREGAKRVVFQGSAGVGKTYAAEELIYRIESDPDIEVFGTVYAAAPTHEALSVLKEKVSSEGVEFSTAHSLLKYRKFTDKNTGAETFAPDPRPKETPLAGVSLLVIDEASMIGEKMLGYLEQYGYYCIIIFVGDNKQILPIGELRSPVFSAGYPTVELTEIIRQGEDNPVINLSRNLDAIWDMETRINSKGEGFCYSYDENQVVTELAKVNGTNDLKYVAYTNEAVTKINSAVRKQIYGPTPAKIEQGETIRFTKPYKTYMNNEKLKVETVDIDTMKFVVSEKGFLEYFTAKVYIINGRQVDEWSDGSLVWKGIFVIHEESEQSFINFTTQLKFACFNKRLSWDAKSKFEGKFANFQYNHALTVHKSQGSTFVKTILNVSDIKRFNKGEELERLLYTGVTRTKELLILYEV